MSHQEKMLVNNYYTYTFFLTMNPLVYIYFMLKKNDWEFREMSAFNVSIQEKQFAIYIDGAKQLLWITFTALKWGN